MQRFKLAVLAQAYNLSVIGSPLGINSLTNEEQFIELSRRVDDWWNLEQPEESTLKEMLPYAYIYICDPEMYEDNASKYDNGVPIKWRHSEFNTNKFNKLLKQL